MTHQTTEPASERAELLNSFERAVHRKGELWERCQGKGWPDAESSEFTKLRDQTIPELHAALLSSDAKPVREWVGLTDEERISLEMRFGNNPKALSFQTESKLREKNAATPAAGGGEAVEFNHYKVVVDALSDLLGQVEQFCVEQGEADFETGRAFRAIELVCEYEYTHPQPSALPDDVVKDAEKLARTFHDVYERLAPSFGYETRKDTREFDPESSNGRLMIAVCREIAAMLKEGKV